MTPYSANEPGLLECRLVSSGTLADRITMDIMKRHARSSMARDLGRQAIISLGLVLPFMILELINRRNLQEGLHGFPVPLFGLMWLLSFAFIFTLIPIVRSLRAENRNLTDRLTLLSRVLLLTVIAWIWVSLVMDQMPCFLGVPNCD